MTRIFLAAILAATCTLAQPRLEGPTAGFVFDAAARQVRAIRGIVGTGAYLGGSLIEDANAASVSPDGKLAVAAHDGKLSLIRAFDSEAAEDLSLGDAPEGQLTFTWSGHDLAVVAAGRAMIWRDLASDTSLDGTWDLSVVEGAVSAALLDGSRLAIASKGGLYVAGADGARLVKQMNDPAALTSAGGDLYVADRGANEIWQIVDYSAPVLFSELSSPVGLQVSKGRLLAASAESRSVAIFDLASHARLGGFDLEFEPTRMEALGSRPLALLNAPSPGEPLWVLDSGDTPAVYFVPAGREQ
ncbi:MAG: hypothetical protein ACKV22_15880 [Bryobacteraceae bacterium]